MRKVSIKQIMSGLFVATCMEISVRLERRPWMFEVHTVKEEGGEEVLDAGERRMRVGRGRRGGCIESC